MNHRERLETCLSGGKPDRPPVALWRHFPVDDQSPKNLAVATIEFQKEFDFDLVKVTPASSFCLKDWGAQDEWRGASEGTRAYTERIIQEPDDWAKLTVLNPHQGYLADQLDCLTEIIDQLGENTPTLQTIFNPLSQAKNLAGQERLIVHLRQYPQALHEGLRIITESTRRFVEAALDTGIAGIFFAVQHAQYRLLSEDEYDEFGKQYDLTILDHVSDLWLNILHLHGESVMFDQVVDYPVQVINWHDRDTPPSLAAGKKRYRGVVCGGLQREQTMVLGTPDHVLSEAKDAIQATNGERFILGTGCVVPITAPRANMIAARRSVDLTR